MPDPLDRLVDDIVTRVQERMANKAPAPASGEPGRAAAAQPTAGPATSATAIRTDGGSSGSNDLARMIDHTMLKPEVTREELKQVCQEAMQYRFKTVCVNSANVAYCSSLLRGSSVVAIAVVGFPLGAMSPTAKAFETEEAIKAGAAEIDMVINIGTLKDHDYARVLDDITSVVKAAAPKPVKVILETGLLEDEEKVIACALAKAGKAAFVKTSTGFSKGGGATVEDIALMRRVVGKEMGVKASGGVRTREDALTMIKAGATRIGASSSVAIVTGADGGGKGY